MSDSEERDAEALLRGAAMEAWEQAIGNASLPIFSRLRCLQRHLRDLGFPEAEALVREARASMSFAASRASQVGSAARSIAEGACLPGGIPVMSAMIIADAQDIHRCLMEGIASLEGPEATQ